MNSLTPRDRMVVAALDLLREGGWWNAGINQVIHASGAPKGSLYHYFPTGKNGLLAEALAKTKEESGTALQRLFSAPLPLEEKIRKFFGGAAERLRANDYTKGCPVGATTLDLGAESIDLQPVCNDVFDHWCASIAEGLADFPADERRGVAEWILATYEGAMVLARARRDGAPLVNAGERLAWACGAMKG